MAKKSAQSFENQLEKLEEVVATLEKGDVSLDESLKLFEEGIKNVRQCSKMLQTAEQKVEALIEKNGDTELEPFEKEE